MRQLIIKILPAHLIQDQMVDPMIRKCVCLKATDYMFNVRSSINTDLYNMIMILNKSKQSLKESVTK